MVTRYMTFLDGERCPVTGQPLDGRYVAVTAPEDFDAREAVTKVFGHRWDYDCPSLAEAETVRGYKLVRHAALIFGPEPEADDLVLPRCMHASGCDQPIRWDELLQRWLHVDDIHRDHDAQPQVSRPGGSSPAAGP